MPGEFYIEDKKQKGDLTEIKNKVTQIHNEIILSRVISSLDLWSSFVPQVILTSAAADIQLPSLTIAGLPSDVSVVRAISLVKYRMIENIFGDLNSLATPQSIQAQKEVDGTWLRAFQFNGGECAVPGTSRESGDVIMGTEDISAQVPVNGQVINFLWSGSQSIQDSLIFQDVQVGLRIWFKV
jgi:hypothetical protein